MEGAQPNLFWNKIFQISIYIMGLDYLKFSLKKNLDSDRDQVSCFKIGIIFKIMFSESFMGHERL